MISHTHLVQLASNCYFDENAQKAFVDATQIRLTLSQKRLLAFFAKNLNRPLHSTDIYYEVWDDFSKEFSSKSVRNLISKTRKLLPMLNIKNLYGGYYILQKELAYPDSDFKDYLLEFLDQSQNAIVITNPSKKDNPIIYVNSAFIETFGYTTQEVFGKNCRFLHKDDNEQIALDMLRNAIKKQITVTLNIRNYTKEGELIYNELTLSPIFDKGNGRLKYFMGVHKDVSFMHHILKEIKVTKK